MEKVDISQYSKADLIDTSEASLSKLLPSHKLSDDEYQNILNILGRAPTFAELGVFSAMWSEHCSYKSSRVHLKRFPTESKDVVQGPGENAGVVRIDGKLCAAFKMESHNHPSYIEPYQGAATGVGGILRDVFCMGSRPIANLNCLRFGSRDHQRTPYLYSEVVRGIGDYGNCIGVPTVGGSVSFDKTYDGNILVNAMTVGVIHEDRIFKGFASGIGNYVVYLGSATGRDGIHGATMASDSFSSESSEERSTVQVGDPFTEKLLLESTLELLKQNLVVGLQDMGAAGLTSSSFEMADRARTGLYIDLDKVPVRTDHMSAYELLLSESQERMLLVVEPSKWKEVAALLEKWQLSYGIIGQVTDSSRVQISYKGKLEVDVPVDPIAENAPKYDRPRSQRKKTPTGEEPHKRVRQHIAKVGIVETLKKLVSDTGSKKKVYDQYDCQIGTKTVLASREEGAAVLWPRSKWSDNPNVGIVVSAGCNERYVAADPKDGAAHAVLMCARKIAAAGGKPLAITDCLNYGNPEDPEIMEEFSQGVDGISEACNALGTPVVSGNVSLYNTTDGVSIAPTPMIGMVGRIDDVHTSRPALCTEDADVYLLIANDATFDYSSSRAARYFDEEIREGAVPSLNWQAENEAIDLLSNENADITAARELGDGGVLATLCKFVGRDFGGKLEDIVSSCSWSDWNDGLAETSGGYLLATKPGAMPESWKNLKHLKCVKVIEARAGQSEISFGQHVISVSEVKDQYYYYQ